MKQEKITFTAVNGWGEETIGIEGIRYDIPELPELKFAIHRHVKYPKSWVISEVSTGLMFTHPGTKKDQLEFVANRLKSYSKEKIMELVKTQARNHPMNTPE